MGFPAHAGLREISVVGGGSAGLMAALTFKQAFPDAEVRVLRSRLVPVIGVGESSTRAVPLFLHGTLALPHAEFFHAVQPVWKLGVRLEWGTPGRHFNYPFDSFLLKHDPSLRKAVLYYCTEGLTDAGRYYSLMDQNRSPCHIRGTELVVEEYHAYHIDNRRFLAFLEAKAAARQVDFVDGDLESVERHENGDIARLRLTDGRTVGGDLFIDCSGFRSLLLGEAMGERERYVSYRDRLFCDTAIVGEWPRGADEPVQSYTTAETMNSGWCWRIDFFDHVTRGYVFASQFCDEEEARREMRAKNPKLGELRTIRFPCGRHENYWVGNVVAIGNASGFVEPLESTALQMITEQLRFTCKALLDSDGQPSAMVKAVENRRFRRRWDDVRDFLTVHYRFNRWLETPFWRHCREHCALGEAEEFVKYYEDAGPSMLANGLISDASIFGFEGYLTILLGQQAPTRRPPRFSDAERAAWTAYRSRVRAEASGALTAEDARRLLTGATLSRA